MQRPAARDSDAAKLSAAIGGERLRRSLERFSDKLDRIMSAGGAEIIRKPDRVRLLVTHAELASARTAISNAQSLSQLVVASQSPVKWPSRSHPRNPAIVRLLAQCAAGVQPPHLGGRSLEQVTLPEVVSAAGSAWRALVTVEVACSAIHEFTTKRRDFRINVADPFEERLRLVMTALQATSERRNGRDGYECRVNGTALAEILKKSRVDNWQQNKDFQGTRFLLGATRRSVDGTIELEIFEDPLRGTEAMILDDLREALGYDLRRSRFCWRIKSKVPWRDRPTQRVSCILPIGRLEAAALVKGRTGNIQGRLVQLLRFLTGVRARASHEDIDMAFVVRHHPSVPIDALRARVLAEVDDVRAARRLFFSSKLKRREVSGLVRKRHRIDPHDLWHVLPEGVDPSSEAAKEKRFNWF